MKKETIYLAMAYTMYEGSYPIKAFEIETDAIKFALDCEAYHFKMPKYPDTDIDSPGAKEIFDSFCEKKERWVNRHPAGRDNTSCDSFMVLPIPKVSNRKVEGARMKNDEQKPDHAFARSLSNAGLGAAIYESAKKHIGHDCLYLVETGEGIELRCFARTHGGSVIPILLVPNV